MAGLSQKDFAAKYDLDASYLSQILNGHRNLGEKAARTLETKIGLPPGALVTPEFLENTNDLQHQPDFVIKDKASGEVFFLEIKQKAASLSPLASPRSRLALEAIIQAVEENRLSEDDVLLMERIAERLMGRDQNHPEPKGSKNRLRERLSKNDSDAQQ
jgi:transcriptional regulator with XRE-family HTH domain